MKGTSEALAATCAHIADERKAEDIVALRVAEMTIVTDYLVIASGRNTRQLRALTEEVLKRAAELSVPILGKEGESESGWMLIDLGDVVVHFFLPETRALYDLELLWGDAPALDWQAATPLSQ